MALNSDLTSPTMELCMALKRYFCGQVAPEPVPSTAELGDCFKLPDYNALYELRALIGTSPSANQWILFFREKANLSFEIDCTKLITIHPEQQLILQDMCNVPLHRNGGTIDATDKVRGRECHSTYIYWRRCGHRRTRPNTSHLPR